MPNPLMRSCLIEVGHIGASARAGAASREGPVGVEAFLSYTSQEPLTDGIGPWGMNRRFEQLNATGGRHASKTGSELAVVITRALARTG